MIHEDFIQAGFSKIENDPMFYYEKELLKQPNEDDLSLKVLYGNSGLQFGFFLSFDGNFIHFHAESPSDATQWADKILNFEPNY